jgi:transposase
VVNATRVGVKLAQRIGARKACAAVARKLAVSMHRMWIEDKDFRFGQPAAAKAA